MSTDQPIIPNDDEWNDAWNHDGPARRAEYARRVMHAQLVVRMREFVELQPATLLLMRLGYQAWINKLAPKAWWRRTFWPRPVVRW